MEYLFSFPAPPLDWCRVTLHIKFSEHKLPYDLGVYGGILHILLNIETLMVVAGDPMLHKKNHLVCVSQLFKATLIVKQFHLIHFQCLQH